MHVTGANVLEGSRAYYAAKSGIEWAVTRLDLGGASDSRTLCDSIDGSSVDITSGALDGYSFAIECECSDSPSPANCSAGTPYTETPDSFSIFIVSARSYKTSLGVSAIGSLGYVSRSLKAKVTDAP